MTRTIFGRLFEDSKITTRFLKDSFSNNIDINKLFAIFNNKEMGNFKVRPSHTMLKEMGAGLWKFFQV